MTLDVPSHVLPSMHEEAAAKIGVAVFQGTAPTLD